jgi:hypothetical protein
MEEEEMGKKERRDFLEQSTEIPERLVMKPNGKMTSNR